MGKSFTYTELGTFNFHLISHLFLCMCKCLCTFQNCLCLQQHFSGKWLAHLCFIAHLTAQNVQGKEIPKRSAFCHSEASSIKGKQSHVIIRSTLTQPLKHIFYDSYFVLSRNTVLFHALFKSMCGTDLIIVLWILDKVFRHSRFTKANEPLSCFFLLKARTQKSCVRYLYDIDEASSATTDVVGNKPSLFKTRQREVFGEVLSEVKHQADTMQPF